MRKTIAVLLSLPYTTGIGFDAWKHEIVNWIPKEENNLDINKRRPLMYYEVMKKNMYGYKTRRDNESVEKKRNNR